MKYNPFKPSSPVPPGMFAGRDRELVRIESALFQTRSDSPNHFMITGERGIGKTSLLLYVQYVAAGDIPIDDLKFNFLVIALSLDVKTTQLSLIGRILSSLKEELGKTEKARTVIADIWSFVQRLEVSDFSIKPKQLDQAHDLVMDQFARSLGETSQRITGTVDSVLSDSTYDGILILIDEADSCSKELQLGTFLKTLLEKLQGLSAPRVVVGLAGLPELRGVLYDSHPSSLRIFEELILEPLQNEEADRVVNRCLEEGNAKNTEQVSIDAGGLETLRELSEGYPHFIQQFGYSAFESNSDEVIDEDDVVDGALSPRGALELIGDRYYRNDFYGKIQKDSYRQVLRIMADKSNEWITKREIRKAFKGNAGTLDNAIKALRDKHIILSKEGSKGVYRLQHRGFALWIKIYASRAQA